MKTITKSITLLKCLIFTFLFRCTCFYSCKYYISTSAAGIGYPSGALSVFIGVRVGQSLHHCRSIWHFSFGHCVVCPSVYGFWLSLWYLQTFLKS